MIKIGFSNSSRNKMTNQRGAAAHAIRDGRTTSTGPVFQLR
uniref:Uncharacterized protein n=1 Tax=Arundo donax TaxID=35708 RepID=A0A0A9A9W6_ARUDO